MTGDNLQQILPESIAKSKVFTGDDLAALAGVPMPEINPAYDDDTLKNIIQYYYISPDEMEKELHIHAQSLLRLGKVQEAWQVLLAGV
jgi:hypothetical protein